MQKWDLRLASLLIGISIIFSSCTPFEERGPYTWTTTLAVDIASPDEQVLFVFTNTSPTVDARYGIEVQPLFAEEPLAASAALQAASPAAAGSRSRPDAYPEAGTGRRGTPEISTFNSDPWNRLTSAAGSLSGSPYGQALSSAAASSTPLPALTPSIGTVGTFRLGGFDPDVEAACRAVIGPIATAGGQRTLAIWVAEESWSGTGDTSGLITPALVDALAAEFLREGASDDIYDWVTAVYGPEWGQYNTGRTGLIPGNDTITILLYDIKGDRSTTGGILGFFWGKDNFLASGEGSIPSSNERLMFYLDAPHYTVAEWQNEMIATLAHEFQHMIHFHQKTVRRGSASATWIDEMCALMTEDLLSESGKLGVTGPRGIDPNEGGPGSAPIRSGQLGLYAFWPETPLTAWLSGADVSRSYATAYSFGAYLGRNFGGAALFRDIVQNAATDHRAVVDAVQLNGGAGETFESLLRKWGEAVLLSRDTAADPTVRYNSGDWFRWSIGGIDYRLGSINLHNYTYQVSKENEWTGIWFWKPDTIGYAPPPPRASNTFFDAGSGFPAGRYEWRFTLQEGVVVTPVVLR